MVNGARLRAADGQVYYDNNGGSNYKLKQYGGRGASAVAGEGAIWIFQNPITDRHHVAQEGFVIYRLLERS